MTNTTNELLQLLRTRYRIDISDDQFNVLKSVLTLYNIKPMQIRIELENNTDNFINNIHLTKKAVFKRLGTEIDLDDVLYMLHTIPFGSDEKYEITYPCKLKYQSRHENDASIYENMRQNVALIRRIYMRSNRDNSNIQETFTLMVLNQNLNVTAGIMFEAI